MRLLAQEDLPGEVEAVLIGLTIWDWLRAVVILVVALVVARIVKFLVIRALGRLDAGAFGGEVVARFSAYVVVVGGIVYALASLGVPITPLLGALGIVGLALAFAFQDIAENFIAGILLLARRPLKPGDQIQSNDHEGVVEDVNLRTVVLRSFGGVTIYLPNSMVLKSPIVNYTIRGVRRTTLEVGVAYDTDLDRAQQVMLECLRTTEGVRSDPPPEAYVQAFSDSAIVFAVRYWHEPPMAEMWRLRDRVARRLKRSLNEGGIVIPFPQRRIWFAQDSDQALPAPEERPAEES